MVPLNFIRLDFGGDEDYRSGRGLRNRSERFARADTVHAGHHHVEEYQVGSEPRGNFDGLLSTVAQLDREAALPLQRDSNDGLNPGIIFDIKNSG